MAETDPQDFNEAPAERAARYWKKATSYYRHACNSEGPAKAEYMEIAMGWAALAAEWERHTIAHTPDVLSAHRTH
jgi:hypothetical protein